MREDREMIERGIMRIERCRTRIRLNWIDEDGGM